MEATTNQTIAKFAKGDKVIHRLSDDDDMVGTVSSVLGNDRYNVEFFISGRHKGGYITEIEFHASELEPCYINPASTKRQPT